MEKLPPDDDPSDSPPDRLGVRRFTGFFRRLTAFDIRFKVWDALNALESNRALRWKIYVSAGAVALATAGGIWYYPVWRQNNAIRVTAQWLAAGKLDRASDSLREAVQLAPNRSDTWAIAAIFEERLGHLDMAANCEARASELAPDDVNLKYQWAAMSLLAARLTEADRALSSVPEAVKVKSAYAERLAGELARLRNETAAARKHFDAAVRLDPTPLPNDEVPLGVVLLSSPRADERVRGRTLLEKWAPDPLWGANALRVLMSEAQSRKDNPAVVRYAEALRIHPARSTNDEIDCLGALEKADAAHFKSALADTEQAFGYDAGSASNLTAWLCGRGRSGEAVRWLRSLPSDFTHTQPVVYAMAEALRVAGDWKGLRDWTKAGSWDANLEYVRQGYSLNAARNLGDTALADRLWKGMLSAAATNGGQAYFVAGIFHVWGWSDEANQLLWITAGVPGLAMNSLGLLARNYDLQHNAEGMYRAFAKLHGLRQDDPIFANNFAYLAALTGNDRLRAVEVARRNTERFPGEAAYWSTYAFTLYRDGRTAEALAALEPRAAAAKTSRAFAFTYGLVLASAGRSADARAAFADIKPEELNDLELQLFNSARSHL
jgi:tetratricopeptide (TPR) repeat protein